MNRNQQIIRTSVVGIAANLFLAAFKAVAGWVAGSVAIVMDAVNNLSDALSSVITKLLYDKYHVIVTVGIYAVCDHGKESELQKGVMAFLKSYPHIEQVHGYFYLEEKRTVTFDVVPDDTVHDDKAFQFQLLQEIRKVYPNYIFSIVIDHIYSK